MPSPQFNKKASANQWFSLTYQSSNELNDALHQGIKKMIAEVLLTGFEIKNIHSYIHGTIIFSISTNKAITILEEIVTSLKLPMANNKPKLHFLISLVAKDNETKINYMYVNGIDSLDEHFQDVVKTIRKNI